MYKNLKMLQNLDKAQIEGLTEKWKNCKNVQKIENLETISFLSILLL